ncbi:hypothetical protein MACH09_44220 [Vibrio sp. MACH09]|uniref:hypothetical protein n=1 Tax=Vibrio sp. MACH09 TaxID=3025122 RepID=UPI002791E364|nr:hypothetical protein [Vibrio sp. MACH09]GLO63914.1 hypothetical protein MACH09_44220 [Vibrio sp. MACH09]
MLSLIVRYIPNETRYVSEDMASQLHSLGRRFNKKLAAGTYAKDIVQRLLIDLTFNSSRLEGNTYSILDTEKLLDGGELANGKSDEETIMILNHKEAILFLIENAEELAVTEKSIGAIDPYRIKYRRERKQVIGQIIRAMIVGDEIERHLEQFCAENTIQDADKFISIATVELDKLHSGAIVSLGVTESLFFAWKERQDSITNE